MSRNLSRATILPWEASVWYWLVPGAPVTSGGLLALTRVFSTVGRSRVDSTLTVMPVFCLNAAFCNWKLASSLVLHTVSTSIDVTLARLLLAPQPQPAHKTEAP